MARDEIKIPENIASMSEDQRKDVARGLIKTTRLNNAKIAQTTGLSTRAVATMRLHAQGKLPNPPVREAAEAPVLAQAPAAAPAGAAQPAGEEVPVVVLKDADSDEARNGPPPPKPLVHMESEMKDLRFFVERQMGTITAQLASLKNGGPGPAPGAGQTQIEERTTDATFDVVSVKVPVDTYRLALFSAWKADYNSTAAQNGGQAYTKDADGFLLDCFDEFMEKRGIDFTYTQTTVMRAPVIARGR